MTNNLPKIITQDNLQKIIKQTLNAWCDEVPKQIMENKEMMEMLNRLEKTQHEPPKKEAWEDDTDFEDCKWFVVWGGYYDGECSIDGFGTRKKAELFMKHNKDEYPTLIKGKVVKSM